MQSETNYLYLKNFSSCFLLFPLLSYVLKYPHFGFEFPRGESQISTWMFFIFHVGVIHFVLS